MTAAAPETNLRPSRILVVDDNGPNRALAKDALEEEGHTVIAASNGREGLAAFEREQPDCVLLDVRMPDLDGFAVCEQIRALPLGADVPVIFITALRDVDTFDRALRAGGDDFLSKPIHPTELVVRVHVAVQLRHMRSTLRAQYELFKQQRDALLRLQLEKERVIAFVVHDLKNPVTTIDLHAQTLLRDRTLAPSVHESARQIRTSSEQLNRMIMNLLDVAKADGGQLAPKRTAVALDRVLGTIIEELQLPASQREVHLRTTLTELSVSADEDLLRRVVANLVENAIRYAPVGSDVTVESARRGSGVELRVLDGGMGVPPELRDKLFEAFAQAEGPDSGPSSRDNRGLGLAFCKRAMDAHGGRIWIEDAEPGSAFCVFFPDEA